MSSFIPVDRQTDFLFPPLVQDWPPENQFARFIVEVIDSLDLTKLTRQYAGRGSASTRAVRFCRWHHHHGAGLCADRSDCKISRR